MKSRYVIDTNVLIAANAINANSPLAGEATPEDPCLREKVWCWLDSFQASDAHMVLDGEGRIEEEYSHKIGFNDFGRQVVIYKYSTCAVDIVDVLYDENGDGLLEEPLQSVVHDRADRKMVAAAIEAMGSLGECTIAFAGESDWHGWEEALLAAGLQLEPIIPEWSYAKYKEKYGT